jgi:hypothetical protein
VTSARLGNIPDAGYPLSVDCSSGATLDVALSGCIYRTATYPP